MSTNVFAEDNKDLKTMMMRLKEDFSDIDFTAKAKLLQVTRPKEENMKLITTNESLFVAHHQIIHLPMNHLFPKRYAKVKKNPS